MGAADVLVGLALLIFVGLWLAALARLAYDGFDGESAAWWTFAAVLAVGLLIAGVALGFGFNPPFP